MLAEVVLVEGDRAAVGVLEALLRLKGAAEGIAVHHVGGKIAKILVQVGHKHRAAVALLELDLDRVLAVDERLVLMLPGARAVEVGVAVAPDRQLVVMRRRETGHIRGVVVHVEHRDPLVIGRVVVHDMGADFAVLLVRALRAVAQGDEGLGGPLLHKDVVVEAVVAVQDGHEAHDLGAVRDVVGGVAGGGAAADAGQRAADQVVHHRHALGGQAQRRIGEQDVVVDQRRAMADFDKDILAHHAALELLGELRLLVVVQQVLGDAGALGLPVAPDAHGAVVDVVAAEGDVDGGVHLDARDLGAAELHHVVDVVDVVVLDEREHAAHAADDAALLAVVDVAAADDVAADLLLQPAVVLAAADGVALHLRGALDMLEGEIVVVVRVAVFADRDARALAVGDLAILNDPALGPVGADHAVLIGGGRGPGGGGLLDAEAADRDVADAGLLRHEAFAADVDLDLLGVGVLALEVRIDHGLAAVLLGVPLVDGGFRLPGALVHFALCALFDAGGLVQHFIVEIDRAGVLAAPGKIPVAVDIGRVGVVGTEHTVGDTADPDIALVGLPVLDFLGAGDDGAQRFDAAVGDAGILGTGMVRVDVFAVHAGGDENFVAGLRHAGRLLDALERPLFAAVAGAGRFGVYIILHLVFLLVRAAGAAVLFCCFSYPILQDFSACVKTQKCPDARHRGHGFLCSFLRGGRRLIWRTRSRGFRG